ncbi:hypothetical protein [Amycolatopsis sp. NPDC049868]|uniref:hypothetical protein n=1 Tax=Amycolatopsis sp. NPDC049868 TaxID=3363934 RepID=UPI0037BBE92C
MDLTQPRTPDHIEQDHKSSAKDRQLVTWVTRLPTAEKERILAQVVRGKAARVQMEVMRRFHSGPWPTCSTTRRGELAPWPAHEDSANRLAGKEDAAWSQSRR